MFGQRKTSPPSMVATLLVCVSIILAVGTSANIAVAAEAPRWVITAIPTPTNILPSTPRNEVQQITVNATGGTFVLEVIPRPKSPFSSFQKTGPIPYNASASEVEAALAKVNGIEEHGPVPVTGGPGGSVPYEVTFEGENGEVPIEPMRIDTSNLMGSATVAQVTEGAPAPEVIVTATNVGGAETDGSTITLSDSLPSWLTATSVKGRDRYSEIAAPLACTTVPVSCSDEKRVDAGGELQMVVTLAAGGAPAAGATNVAEISGGAAEQARVEGQLRAGSGTAGFGPAPGGVFAALSTMQAGAHPNFTTFFELATSQPDISAEDAKDVRFDLPVGFVGSTVGLPKCTMNRVVEAFGPEPKAVCPNDTMVGVAVVNLEGRSPHPERGSFVVPVYDIAPAPGEPAAFGFDAIELPVRLDTSVLSNGDYAVRVTASDISQAVQTLSSNVTIWGVPAEHSGPGHNGEFTLVRPFRFGGVDPGQSPVPLLTNPQQCVEPLVATMSTDSWDEPGVFRSVEAPVGTLTGCGIVPFGSSFTFLPDTLEAGVPAGYTFDLSVPQKNEVNTLATSSLKDFTLKLPVGVVVSPSAAWGLKACSDTEFFGSKYPSQDPASPAQCPREAQVGEVEVETPDLEKPLRGQVFLASPECDPCTPADAEGGKMVRLFVQLVGEGEAGIVVKLEGHGRLDQATGQITTVFDHNPQVPFNKLHFVLGGGPRAVLANPRVCGTLTASGDLTPWNTGPAVSDSLPFYEFAINEGCFGPQFAPSFAAGMTNIQAGAYGPFTLSFGRSDHDQFLAGISTRMPSGLLGKLSGVQLCKEPQASMGTCGVGSLIGHVQVLTGPGADPFLVSGGQVFLTEAYGGAPYGLSIVVPAVAGPYTLSGTTGQGTVVVRAKIMVDPHTAALTVTSDPLPTMLDGIPLQLKAVNVTIDRPEFTFNPTSCNKTAIAGSLSSFEGMSANVSTPFQVTNCANLAFKPKLTASTSGKTSRANGASLHVKLTYPGGSYGANISKVKVDLPSKMPSRLTTLQKACPSATFEENPANCPAASIVGSARATTPVLPVPLTGPAYFVSHGGEAFPDLNIVLQGYGTTVDLVGTTFINNKTSVTSSTFKSVPDVPVGTFELTLPQGKYSALAAPAGLCGRKLVMPTSFTAQNGLELHQSTPITVTGCTKHKTKKAHKARTHHKHK
jgi:hypothetical protein